MKKMSAKVTAAILAASAVLSACGGSGSSETTAAAAGGDTSAAETTAAVADANATYKDTLNIAVVQQAPSLDLHKNSSLIARQIMDGTVFEKLVTQNSKAEAVPELCEKKANRWTAGPDIRQPRRRRSSTGSFRSPT